jgi:hypothetical protein
MKFLLCIFAIAAPTLCACMAWLIYEDRKHQREFDERLKSGGWKE